MILCKAQYAKDIDKSVFPGLQGGLHMQTIASIAVTLEKALQPEFKEYATQVLKNAKALAETLMAGGAKLITDGTDNHMMVVDTTAAFGVGGTEAEIALDKAGITCNKQVIPDDPNPPLKPSGIRLGTPAATTRGFKEAEMKQIGEWMLDALKHWQDDAYLAGIKTKVKELCVKFPVPGVSA
jgi:glycine hydroxymethyltransferase